MKAKVPAASVSCIERVLLVCFGPERNKKGLFMTKVNLK